MTAVYFNASSIRRVTNFTFEGLAELKVVFSDSHSMVLTLDGNLDHVAHTRTKIGLFKGKKIGFVTALDLNKCLKQVK